MMKNLFKTLALLCVCSNAFAADSASKYAGNWIDIDLESGFKNFETNQDLKAFCSNAFYKGEEIDQILSISAEGTTSICALNKDQALPLGQNCKTFGTILGDVLTIKYDDGSTVLGQIKELELGHLEVEIQHPKQGNVSATEIWEIRLLSDSREAVLDSTFKRCINEIK